MKTPFAIIPWDIDFLSVLHHRVNEACALHPERAVIVFPHDRPRRYLLEHFRAEGRAMLLPAMYSVRDFFSEIRPFVTAPSAKREAGLREAGLREAGLREAGLIDQVAFLHTACLEAAEPGEPLAQRLLHGGEAALFPWGVRLAALIEECLSQHVTPMDIRHAQTEVAPFGADLLGALGRIFECYITLLETKERTTPGLDAYRIAEAFRTMRDGCLQPLDGKTVFLAGFHALTGSEEIVFKTLWESGAQVLLHTDPALAQNSTPHWACAEHEHWIRRWGARTELAHSPAGTSPDIRFFVGYDLHSQLEQLERDVTDALDDPAGSMAIALTHPELLLPVLHQLPAKDCNISLGYPLERTQLCRLIDLVLDIAEKSTDDGRVPWREFAALASHPWLRLLHSAPSVEAAENRTALHAETEGTDPVFTRLLTVLDEQIRQGSRFQNPDETMALALHRFEEIMQGKCGATECERAAQLLREVLDLAIPAWKDASTLAQMANCLSAFANLLAGRGHALWKRFPLDAEYLVRLIQRVIPPLRDNEMAHATLPPELRHAMLRSLMREERVPFEADPISGLQVLGMLETRLLQFSKVFVVDATDDVLPGAPSHDPLLPDSLRAVLGLPGTGQREQLAAHTFYRLLAGAGEVCLYWQEGTQPGGLLDGVKQRSRFVEQLVWREEQANGRLIRPGDAPLRTAVPSLRPPRTERANLKRLDAHHAVMDALLRKPLSPARLDAYLRCPLNFYYQHIARLRSTVEVDEGDTPNLVGDLLHAVLGEAYGTRIDKPTTHGDIGEDALARLFTERLAQTTLLRDLPPESAVMLSLAGPEKLRAYLRNQPEAIIVRGLEMDVEAALFTQAGSPVLRGRLDRIDERGGELVILDYKTGRIPSVKGDVWKEEGLWDEVQQWQARPVDQDRGDMLLRHLAENFDSIQLPAYLFAYHASTGKHVADAAWVAIGDDGREYFLFDKVDEELRGRACREYIPALLGFLAAHMRHASHYRTHEGKHCGWCLFGNLCMVMK